jgi:L-amino acid N-acyltransferase YncA
MELKIRKAEIKDLNSINEIYNYYVMNSTCTYQTEPESIESRIEWFSSPVIDREKYPVIVCELHDEVIGWASISPFNKRTGYKLTVQDSIYIRNDMLNKGIGSMLLKELIRLSKSIGYHSIIAGISSDQEPSIKLHEKFNFKKSAHLKEVGFKFNKWLDVVYFQLII